MQVTVQICKLLGVGLEASGKHPYAHCFRRRKTCTGRPVTVGLTLRNSTPYLAPSSAVEVLFPFAL